MQHPIETQICAVTVYTDQALVTRRGTITLTGAETELAILNLPTTLKAESVRANGEGTIAVRLLGVRTERVFATEPIGERVGQINTAIQQLQEQQQDLKYRVESLQLQRTFVQSLSEKSVERFSQSLARQQVGLGETADLLGFLGQRYSDYAQSIAQHDKERVELDKQIQVLKQQLQQLQTPQPRQSYSLIVAIEPSGAGEFTLEVTYGVNCASWTPLYDIQVNSDGVNLSYLAEVKQTSGEDWSEVALTLSTAKPGLGTLPPKVQPWYIDIPRPPAAPMQSAPMVGAMRKRAQAPGAGGVSDAEEFGELGALLMDSSPAPIAAESVMATTATEGGVVTFQVGGGSKIPSDGTPHKITIFSDDYPCRLEYVAMPRLVSFAYLQAIVTNPAQGVTLLPGRANIFRGNTFVGVTPLENVAPNQEFQLNLGIDEGLKIDRTLVEREVDKKFLGNQRRITYGYRLTVTNLRSEPVTLKLTEQLPVSRNEQIKVRLTKVNPTIQLGEMGVLEWTLTLQPQVKQEISYQFVVEHPPELAVTGLNL